MKIQSEIDTLEQLAAVDAALAELREELGQEQSALQAKRDLQLELEARLERSRNATREMDRQRGDNLQEVRQMNIQLERSREKLARCRTEKEANAVQRELEELRKLQRDREVEIQKLDQINEQAKNDVAQTEQKLATILEDLGATEGDVKTKLGALSQQQTERLAKREELVKALKPLMYRRYEQIRERRGSGIAQTTQANKGKCSACHIMLPPMMFQTLRRREGFDQCPSCQRIIYFVAPKAEAEEP